MVAKEEDVIPRSVYLVAKRPPLSKQPLIWRWLARFVYRHINWCPDYGIEYQGVYSDEAEARYAASEDGGFLIELPLNTSLPQEACQYGAHDFPLSEVSQEYRKRKFRFAAVPQKEVEERALLEAKIEQLVTKSACA